MELSRSQKEGVEVLELAGEIDLHASPALREELRLCVEEKVPVLVADFTQVDYIDSSGLATLIEYVRSASDYDGRFGIFGLQEKVRTIFDLVRLNELFVIAPSLHDAIAELGHAG